MNPTRRRRAARDYESSYGRADCFLEVRLHSDVSLGDALFVGEAQSQPISGIDLIKRPHCVCQFSAASWQPWRVARRTLWPSMSARPAAFLSGMLTPFENAHALSHLSQHPENAS